MANIGINENEKCRVQEWLETPEGRKLTEAQHALALERKYLERQIARFGSEIRDNSTRICPALGRQRTWDEDQVGI